MVSDDSSPPLASSSRTDRIGARVSTRRVAAPGALVPLHAVVLVLLGAGADPYGAVKGGILTAWRLLRCAPWGKGGYDPPRWFGEEVTVDKARTLHKGERPA